MSRGVYFLLQALQHLTDPCVSGPGGKNGEWLHALHMRAVCLPGHLPVSSSEHSQSTHRNPAWAQRTSAAPSATQVASICHLWNSIFVCTPNICQHQLSKTNAFTVTHVTRLDYVTHLTVRSTTVLPRGFTGFNFNCHPETADLWETVRSYKMQRILFML